MESLYTSLLGNVMAAIVAVTGLLNVLAVYLYNPNYYAFELCQNSLADALTDLNGHVSHSDTPASSVVAHQ